MRKRQIIEATPIISLMIANKLEAHHAKLKPLHLLFSLWICVHFSKVVHRKSNLATPLLSLQLFCASYSAENHDPTMGSYTLLGKYWPEHMLG